MNKLVVMILVGSALQGLQAANQVSNVELVSSKNVGKDVELAKFAVYFTEKPQIKRVDSALKQTGMRHQLAFFIPKTTLASRSVSSELAALIKKNTTDAYRITLAAHKQQAEDGLLCTIVYDPKSILVRTSAVEARSKGPWQHALVFTFHDQMLLKKLKAKKIDVLQTAWSDGVGLYLIA
jgi:hypothetical protein